MSSNSVKNVVILGSTGSVGRSTMEVVRAMPDRLRACALSAGSRWEELSAQIREFRPDAAAIADTACRDEMQQAVADSGTQLFFGQEGICKVAEWPDADVVVHGISGWAGFAPAVRAVQAGHTLALANKESLVVGGHILMKLAESAGAMILPVDSEQCAIAQAMRSGRRHEVARVIITASGGPFRCTPPEELREVTPQQALCHPTWQMGKKITIDSATLVNKALEIVEARWLFDLRPDQIDVVIHPQSVIHSLVEFIDGSIVAQLGVPDMRLPIQYALTYPERFDGLVEHLDLGSIGQLELTTPDLERFPALSLGYEVAEKGGTSGAVLNAADEVAVEAFLEGKIRFTDIVPIVQHVLSRHAVKDSPDIAEIERADHWAREETLRCSS